MVNVVPCPGLLWTSIWPPRRRPRPLPASTRAHYEAKGRLYNLTKDLISAGQALHTADPEAAAKYNSKLLYRRAGKTKVETEGTGTTSTEKK